MLRSILFTLMLLQVFVFAKPGDLDKSFGTEGIVNTVFNWESYASSVAIQDDQRIVATGTERYSNYSGSGQSRYVVVRYLDNGDLDTSFGPPDEDGHSNGFVSVDVGGDAANSNSIILQDDKIIVVGSNHNNGTGGGTNRPSDFTIVRLENNGTLDYDFGEDGNGIVTTDIGDNTGDYAYDVAIQNDGKIVVVGESEDDTGYSKFAAVRYEKTGTLDHSFGADGIITLSGAIFREAHGIAIQDDNKSVITGYAHNGSNYVFVTTRYESNGTLDSAFGSEGIVSTPIEDTNAQAYSIAIQKDGNIVVAGYNYWDDPATDDQVSGVVVVRYLSTGILDNTFGNNGIVTTSVGNDLEGEGLVLQEDGKIVVVGSYDDYDEENDIHVSKSVVLRYKSDGTLDGTFGNNGISMINNNGGSSGVALQKDEKIVAVGGSDDENGDNQFTVLRYQGGDFNFPMAPIYYLLQ